MKNPDFVFNEMVRNGAGTYFYDNYREGYHWVFDRLYEAAKKRDELLSFLR